jgi:hypothetical protein
MFQLYRNGIQRFDIAKCNIKEGPWWTEKILTPDPCAVPTPEYLPRLQIRCISLAIPYLKDFSTLLHIL